LAEPLTHHEEEALGKAYDARLMRRLLRYLRPYRMRVVIAVLVLLVGAMVELVGPWLTRIALDDAIPQGDSRMLMLLAAAWFASLIAAFVLQYGQTLFTTWLGQRVMYDLRREIFGRLQRLGVAFFDRNPVGRLMTRVTSDVEVLNELFSSGVVTVFGDVFTLVLIIMAMLVMDWRLALVTMSVMPVVFFVAMLFRSRIRNAYRDIRTRLARLNAFLQENISGMSVTQLFGREKDAARRFRQIDDQYLDAHLRSITYYALFFPVIELLTSVALAIIIVYGGARMIGGGITVGIIAAFLQYARRFFRPIQDLSEKYNMLQGAMASSERIFRLLDSPADLVVGVGQPIPPGARGRIEFRDVWFAYRRSGTDSEWDWVLRGVSFTVEPGQRVAIVGHTGAGKTTIASLLLRFYEPQKGEILFDGVPIRDIDVHALRDSVGLVLQDVFMFSRDVKYNIRLGRDDIDEASFTRAAERVGAGPMVAQLPMRFDQPLGERGASLSVGERQLLSFARALAFDPLVLVLDEATSSVDSALEERIENALDTLMRGRTSIVIAHRLSTVQNADRILVMHHGELREEGTHESLIEKNGLYARLYELQFADAVGAART
jgi:ATP-binding cassette subfamily B protein